MFLLVESEVPDQSDRSQADLSLRCRICPKTCFRMARPKYSTFIKRACIILQKKILLLIYVLVNKTSDISSFQSSVNWFIIRRGNCLKNSLRYCILFVTMQTVELSIFCVERYRQIQTITKMSLQRRCNVSTLQRRCCDAVCLLVSLLCFRHPSERIFLFGVFKWEKNDLWLKISDQKPFVVSVKVPCF